jgi:predicted transcriptional regulator of viral defense system
MMPLAIVVIPSTVAAVKSTFSSAFVHFALQDEEPRRLFVFVITLLRFARPLRANISV